MWRTENSPEYEAKLADECDERRRQAKRRAREVRHIRAKIWGEWGEAVPWRTIEDCPFEALSETYGYEAVVLVTDGKKTARATISRRFGTPMEWVGESEPEYVMRDGKLHLEGDGEWKAPEWPKWLKEYQFTDEDGMMNYAGGEEIGKDEIDFIPTKWLLLP